MKSLNKSTSTATASFWTIQRAVAWETLKPGGSIRCKPEMVDPYLVDAYDWMAAEIAQRVGPPPKGVRWPVWCWPSKPDLRTSGFAPSGTSCVRIEFYVDQRRVLLSGFDGWHSVLNDHTFYFDDQSMEEPVRSSEEEKRESWRGIFDIPRFQGELIQGALWQVQYEAITHVKHFMAR